MDCAGTLLFVYGTLRRGFRHPAARRLHERGEFLKCGTIRGELHHCGAYPGLTLGGGRIRGDIFRVGPQLLRYLDWFEGDEFQRVRTAAQTESGGKARVWVYVLRHRPD